MPRRAKYRKVCFAPENRRFLPEIQTDSEPVILTVEELEALRLADSECLDQGQAAEMMDVSRGTFQRILYSARQKTAEALTTGKAIFIQGGNYQLSGHCGHGACRCRRCHNQLHSCFKEESE